VEIGGVVAGTQYDQLVVSGNATLGGKLEVTMVNGFMPVGGAMFNVVRAAGVVNGVFAATVFPATPSFTANYIASAVDLTTGVSGNVQLNNIVYSINTAAPENSVLAEYSAKLSSNTLAGPGSLALPTAYLETSSGQSVTLSLTQDVGALSGVYVNVTTGELTKFDAPAAGGAAPAPGIYVSNDDSKKVVVVTKDESTGKTVVLSGSSASTKGSIGPNAKIKKLPGCS
jgi:hypothetical protein